MRSEVANATGNVKYNRSSFLTPPSSVVLTILTIASSWEAAGAASLGLPTSLSSGSLVHFFLLAVTLKNVRHT